MKKIKLFIGTAKKHISYFKLLKEKRKIKQSFVGNLNNKKPYIQLLFYIYMSPFKKKLSHTRKVKQKKANEKQFYILLRPMRFQLFDFPKSVLQAYSICKHIYCLISHLKFYFISVMFEKQINAYLNPQIDKNIFFSGSSTQKNNCVLNQE